MSDTFEFTLNNPLTEEQWDMIADVDMERTDSVTFHTKHGKEVEFAKVRHGKWIYGNEFHWYTASCSRCGYKRTTDIKAANWNAWKYCPNCGAYMAERKEE